MWEQVAFQYVMSFIGSFVGAALAAIFFVPRMMKSVGRNIGTGFNESVEEHYAKREKEITRKKV